MTTSTNLVYPSRSEPSPAYRQTDHTTRVMRVRTREAHIVAATGTGTHSTVRSTTAFDMTETKTAQGQQHTTMRRAGISTLRLPPMSTQQQQRRGTTTKVASRTSGGGRNTSRRRQPDEEQAGAGTRRQEQQQQLQARAEPQHHVTPRVILEQPTLHTSYTVDAHGTGRGLVRSTNGDVYEGDFRNWLRHGFGVQTWFSGEVYRGTWKEDQQHEGIFVDAEGRSWRGNFLTKEVFLVDEYMRPLRIPPVNPQQEETTARGLRKKKREQRGSKAGALSARYGQQHRPNRGDSTRRRRRANSQRTKREHTIATSVKTLGYERQEIFSSRKKKENGTGGDASGAKKDNKKHKDENTLHALSAKIKDPYLLKILTAKVEARKRRAFVKQLKAEGLELVSGDRFENSELSKVDKDIPGVGAYSLDRTIGADKPAVSMGAHTGRSMLEEAVRASYNPGPKYHPDDSAESVAKVSAVPPPSFGAELVCPEDAVDHADDVPGPGAYSVKVTKSGESTSLAGKIHAAPDFGTGAKSKPRGLYISRGALRELLGEFSPGPAHYSLPGGTGSGREGVAVTMGGRPQDLMHAPPKTSEPGPGSHNPYGAEQQPGKYITHRNVPGFTMSNVKEQIAYNQGKWPGLPPPQYGWFSPGPAVYFPDIAAVVAEAPAVSFTPHLRLRPRVE